MSADFNPWEDIRRVLQQLETQPRNTEILVPGTMFDRFGLTEECGIRRYDPRSSESDPIADLRTAVEQIKREPRSQPDMVPWEECMPRIMVARETWLTLKRFRRVMHWRDRKRGKRRAYFAMRSGR